MEQTAILSIQIRTTFFFTGSSKIDFEFKSSLFWKSSAFLCANSDSLIIPLSLNSASFSINCRLSAEIFSGKRGKRCFDGTFTAQFVASDLVAGSHIMKTRFSDAFSEKRVFLISHFRIPGMFLAGVLIRKACFAQSPIRDITPYSCLFSQKIDIYFYMLLKISGNFSSISRAKRKNPPFYPRRGLCAAEIPFKFHPPGRLTTRCKKQ